jgi:hypothetical protein
MSTMMMERTQMGMPAMGMPGMGPMAGMPGTIPMAPGAMMIPRCGLRFEKCTGGMKITCSCDDAVACGMLQNLCTMMQNGLCSCCCLMNGMVVYSCNLTMGMCECEMTKDGCCMTVTSGDARCCAMIQACCDCLCAMCDNGCTCCVMLNNAPVCCGTTCTTSKAKAK